MMNTSRRNALSAVGMLFALCACASSGVASAPHAEEQRLCAQADAWDRAIVAKQRDAVAANMAESFLQIGSDGRLSDKQAFLAAILSPDLVIHPYTVNDLRVRLYGDTALLTGSTDMTGTFKGRAFRSHYRYTDVYVKQSGVWRVVNVQTTEIPD